MPLPPSVTLIPLHGKVLRNDPQGTPAVGRVVFTPPYPLRDTAGDVVLGAVPWRVNLDMQGEFTVSLPASDDPDLTPSGWAWRVDVETDAWRETFRIMVPVATVGTLELADLVPVITPPVVGIYAPINHTHTAADVTSGTLAYARLPVGTVAGTVAAGDDPRLSDARTPVAHGHAAVDIASGTLAAARLPVGSGPGTVAAGDDPRLSDARPPTAHVHDAADVTTGAFTVARLPVGTTAGTVAAGDDARLADARTPTAHAATHAAAGADPVTPAAIGAFPATGGVIGGNVQVDGDLQLQGTGKAYRFRRGGGALDVDATGTDLFFSVFSGPDFDGDQRKYFRLESGAQVLHLIGKVVVGVNEFGEQIVFDPGAIPAVTGSRGGNAALESLLTALASRGLITDGTTA